MKKNYIYNVLWDVIEKIENISKEDKNAKFVWGGNARSLTVVNYVLSRKNIKVLCAIDNDVCKQNKKASDINISEFNSEFISNIDEYDVMVYSPQQAIEKYKDAYFIIPSKFALEIKQQLLDMGIAENKIETFSTSVNDNLLKKFKETSQFDNYRRIDLREMQLMELEILKVFKKFCEDKGLKYFLSSGSLLGAVRHKGFIPWDDDIDVYMPYEDFIEFMTIFSDSDNRYRAVYWENDENYFLAFGKLMDMETLLFHRGYPVQGCMGVYIDIFPLAGYDADKTKEEFWMNNEKLNEYWHDYYVAKTLLNEEVIDTRSKVIEQRYKNSFYKSDIVGARHIIAGIKQWCVPRKIYESTIMIEFEGEYFAAPVGYDELLKERYGDYMKLPPVEKRKTHAFSAFIKKV